MMEAMKNWIMMLTASAILSAIALAVTPEGAVKKVVTFACGLAMLSALISPLLKFDVDGFTKHLRTYNAEAEKFSAEITEVNDSLSRLIIERQSEAYILDKGKEFGMENLNVEITAKWSTEGYWYPYEAKITSDPGGVAETELKYILEADFGIPQDRQIWSAEDE
jgi:hypothetical protein